MKRRKRKIWKAYSNPSLLPALIIYALLLLLLLLLLSEILGFMRFFALPHLLNFITSILLPNPAKNTWNSVNLFLLIVATICAALHSHNDDDRSISASQQIIEFPSYSCSFLERPIHQDPARVAEMEYSSCLVRLRCSRSYPMLRWEPSNDPCRFSDDIRVNCTTSRRRSDQHRRKEEDEASSSRYIIPIDKLVIRTEDRSPSPPPPVVKKKACRRTLPKIAKNEDVEKLQHPEKKSRGLKDTGRGLARLYEKKQKKKALGSSRPPPPATLFYNFTEKSSKREAVFQVNYDKPVTVGRTLPKIAKDEDVEKLQHLEKKGKKKKKSGGGVKEIARALSRLFKKKKQKKRALRSPPPPPPPATMFYNFFEESRRRKSTVHSVTTPPPPPLLLDSKSFSEGEDDDDDGLLKPAAPPPVPPFEVEKVKFPVSGDYVLVSSERWEGSEIVVIPMRKESRPSLPLVLYESPEVDADADIFIARFHEKLRLEKMNS